MRRGPGLLPALPVAGLGHGAGLPRAAGGRRTRRRAPPPSAGSTGWWRGRCSTSPATGRRSGRACRPAAGRSSTPTRTTPTSTTRPSSSWRCDRADPRRATRDAIARGTTGSWACRAATAAGARSTPTTRTSTSTTSRSPTTARCSTRRPPTSRRAASACWPSSAHDRPTRRCARALEFLRARAGAGRLLVRPLGHQLRLRHLVGAGARSTRSACRQHDPMVRRAVDVAEVAASGPDGGWGEDCAAYWADAPQGEDAVEHRLADGLGAARADGGRRGRQPGGRARRRAICSDAQAPDGSWEEEHYTAVGFPRVFYLRYHGYRAVLPALGAGPLPQPDARQRAGHAPRHVVALAAVTGLEAEARIARRAGLDAESAGAGLGAATRASEALSRAGCHGRS